MMSTTIYKNKSQITDKNYSSVFLGDFFGWLATATEVPIYLTNRENPSKTSLSREIETRNHKKKKKGKEKTRPEAQASYS